MGLLEQASLVITPNAVKTGKLYSAIPNNGTGDLDVVRATSATRVNSAGLIETVGNNIARLDYTNGSCPSILVEPQRTNLCLQSEMFTQSPWIGTAIISANTNIAPNGTLTADTLSDNSTTVRQQIYQEFNVSTNTAYTTSVFIKKTTGTISHYPALQIFYSGVVNRIIAIILNTTTGTFNFLASGVSPVNLYSAVVKDYQDYWRVEFTTIDNQSNNNLSIALLPAFSQDGTTTSSVVTGSNAFWGTQLEAGANATSYIPTTTSSVTRNADSISKSEISSLIGQTEGSIYCEIDNIVFNQNSGIFVLQNNTDQFNNRIGFRYTSSPVGALNAFIRTATNFVVNLEAQVNVVGQKYKMCFTYNQTQQKFFINGVLVNSRTGSYAQPNTLDQAQLGTMANNNFPSVIGIKSALVFTNVLSDAEAIQLTTI